MRVAAVLSGEPRFCTEFDFFLNSLPKDIGVDWFMYLWGDNRGGRNLVAESWITPDYNWAYAKLKNELPENHQIHSLVFGDRDSVRPPNITHRKEWTIVGDVWGMYNSIYQADQLRQNWETENNFKYDLVIRTRPDIGFQGYLDLYNIKQMIENKPNIIVTSNHQVHGLSGYRMNDMFAIGSSQTMTTYSECVDWIPIYYNQGLIFHPETQLAFHCIRNGLETVFIDFGDLLIRRLGHWTSNDTYISNYGRWA